MKVINGAILLAVAVMMIGCGGNTNKDALKDTSTEQVADSNKVAAGSYANEQLGYSITYPKDILILDESTVNSEQQVFKPVEGKAELRIFSDKRVDKSGTPIAFNAAYEQDIADRKGRQIAHSSLSPNYYVISGLDGDLLYYQKTIFSKGGLVTAVLKYPKEERDIFNAMLNPLFGSFK
ncbi:hypothetical protein CLV62_14921 [Dysgonomonas alginatilytica]|uniref:Lipoprotein n=1 Tax=Dysgonomonas alginatilytica TaxID=1605892 RepID=A0A2V3PK33_9BACT|nr:PsbP-related protein [Dysgonomonas alginatilytica]PXV58412.1 hypothetical protein CLV62_14921 [Dysgonomonas alginatilytica]